MLRMKRSRSGQHGDIRVVVQLIEVFVAEQRDQLILFLHGMRVLGLSRLLVVPFFP
ncbi:hypothetical protein D3C76_1820240 [compost metagenome]